MFLSRDGYSAAVIGIIFILFFFIFRYSKYTEEFFLVSFMFSISFKEKVRGDKAYIIVLSALIFGFIGSKILVIIENIELLLNDFSEIKYFIFSGKSIVGGLLGGGITFFSFKPCCDKLKASLQDTLLSNPNHDTSLDVIDVDYVESQINEELANDVDKLIESDTKVEDESIDNKDFE